MGNDTFWVIIVVWILFLVADAIYFETESRKAVERGSLEDLYDVGDRSGMAVILSSIVPIIAIIFWLP